MPKSLSLPLVLGALCAAASVGGAAHAQLAAGVSQPNQPLQPPPAEAAISGVEVIAPRVVERTLYGVVSREMKLSVRVPYGDLDMATPAGAAALDKRVADAADYACRQLVLMYPDGTPEKFYCVKEAVHGAQPQVIEARASR